MHDQQLPATFDHRQRALNPVDRALLGRAAAFTDGAYKFVSTTHYGSVILRSVDDNDGGNQYPRTHEPRAACAVPDGPDGDPGPDHAVRPRSGPSRERRQRGASRVG